MNTDLLVNLGLTKSEIKVYLTLLELNAASAAEIAERSGMYRKNTYDALLRLIKKGLVGFEKIERRRIFKATDPHRLIEFVEMRKRELQTILPELKQIYKSKPTSDEVMVFKGREGIKTLFADVLKSKLDYDKLGSGEKFKESLPYFYPQYQRRKVENEIHCRAIYSESERNAESIREFVGEKKFLANGIPGNITTIIYGTKIAFFVWKENPVGVFINNQEIADCHRFYFQMLWDLASA